MEIYFLCELQHCVTSLSGHCISIISLAFLGHHQQANECLHLLADGGIRENYESRCLESLCSYQSSSQHVAGLSVIPLS